VESAFSISRMCIYLWINRGFFHSLPQHFQSLAFHGEKPFYPQLMHNSGGRTGDL